MALQLVLHQNMVFQVLDFMMVDTTMVHTTTVDTIMGMSEFETNLSKILKLFQFIQLNDCLFSYSGYDYRRGYRGGHRAGY